MEFSLKIYYLGLIRRKHQPTQIQGQSSKYLSTIIQISEDHERQGKTKKLYTLETKERWWLNPGLDPGSVKKD